jgi:hypothetical protein
MMADSHSTASVSGDAIFAVCLLIGTLFTILGTLLSVLFLMIIGTIGEEIEVRHFASRMGFLLLTPTVSTIFGCLGALVGLMYWIFVSYGFKFIFLVVISLGSVAFFMFHIPLFSLFKAFG